MFVGYVKRLLTSKGLLSVKVKFQNIPFYRMDIVDINQLVQKHLYVGHCRVLGNLELETELNQDFYDSMMKIPRSLKDPSDLLEKLGVINSRKPVNKRTPHRFPGTSFSERKASIEHLAEISKYHIVYIVINEGGESCLKFSFNSDVSGEKKVIYFVENRYKKKQNLATFELWKQTAYY